MDFQILLPKVNSPILIFYKISLSFLPLKGGSPDNNTYNTTPADQTSHL